MTTLPSWAKKKRKAANWEFFSWARQSTNLFRLQQSEHSQWDKEWKSEQKYTGSHENDRVVESCPKGKY